MKKDKGNVLIIACHSDDQILGAGGVIYKYSKEGYNVKTIILSYGEGAHPWLKAEAVIPIRIKESKKADKIVHGNGIQFFDFKEGKFPEGFKKFEIKLVEEIKKFNPIKIFTHSEDDPHPDHNCVGNALIKIINNYNINTDLYAFDVWTIFKFKRNYPRLVIDITNGFGKKLRGLKAFESQKIQMQWPLTWSVYFKAFFNGLKYGYRFAEVFYKVK
jgi:LmbE family N-acetylglucosaminyl deacetylase